MAAALSRERTPRKLTVLPLTRPDTSPRTWVAAGLSERLEIQVSYAIGMASPTSISIETFGTNKVSDDVIVGLVNKHFDLRPGAIIRDLDLRKPIYRQTAAYGHFGRDDLDLPWEKTDKAATLRREAFVEEASQGQSATS